MSPSYTNQYITCPKYSMIHYIQLHLYIINFEQFISIKTKFWPCWKFLGVYSRNPKEMPFWTRLIVVQLIYTWFFLQYTFICIYTYLNNYYVILLLKGYFLCVFIKSVYRFYIFYQGRIYVLAFIQKSCFL
jgi:hypothetical protein